MSHKSVVIVTTAVASTLALAAVLTTYYTALQTINPIAVLSAVTVAIIGIAWFKKTTNS